MKLLKVFFFFICIIKWVHLPAQEFEGKLIYKMDMKIFNNVEKMGLTKETLIEKMKQEGAWADSKVIYYNKNGFYCEKLGDFYSIYRPDSNKIYTFQDNSQNCVVMNQYFYV